jgi:hypothetical protein
MTLTADTSPSFRAFRIVLAGGASDIAEGLGYRCSTTCNTDTAITNALRVEGTESICGGATTWNLLAAKVTIPPPVSNINNAMVFRDLQNGFGQFNWRATDDLYWADIETQLGGTVADDSPCDTILVNHGLVDSCEAFAVNGMVHPLILASRYMGGGRGEPGLFHIVGAMMPEGGQTGICNTFFGALTTFTAQCLTIINLLPAAPNGWDWARRVRMGGGSDGRSATVTIAGIPSPLVAARDYVINCAGRPVPGDLAYARRCVLPISNALLQLRYVQQASRNVGRCYLPPVFQLAGDQAELFITGCFGTNGIYGSIGRRTDYRALHMSIGSGCGCQCVGNCGPCGGACGNHNFGIVGAFDNLQQINDMLYNTLPVTTDANFPHSLAPIADFPPQRFANGLVPGTDGFAATCSDLIAPTGCIPPINDYCGFGRQEAGRWDSLIRNNEGPFQAGAYVLDSGIVLDAVTGTLAVTLNDGGRGVYGYRAFTMLGIPSGWENVPATTVDEPLHLCPSGTFTAVQTGGYRNGIAMQYFIWPPTGPTTLLMATDNPWLKGDRLFVKQNDRVYIVDSFIGIINVVVSSYAINPVTIATCPAGFTMSITMAKELWTDTPKNQVQEDVNYVDAVDCFINFCGPDKWKGMLILVIIVVVVVIIGVIILTVAIKAYAKSRTA